MNKGEFVDAVAAKGDMSKADAAAAVDAVLARTGRNPRTGEPLQIAASNVPSFKAGKALKDAVN